MKLKERGGHGHRFEVFPFIIFPIVKDYNQVYIFVIV